MANLRAHKVSNNFSSCDWVKADDIMPKKVSFSLLYTFNVKVVSSILAQGGFSIKGTLTFGAVSTP